FLSPLDVHINRSPIPGKIVDVRYSPGKFLMATNEKASLVNEQNALTIQGEKITVVCKQIAGILARRIVCWNAEGDSLGLGERFGMIKFSSRTDVLLPANVRVTVKEGDRVRGGTTVIGRISGQIKRTTSRILHEEDCGKGSTSCRLRLPQAILVWVSCR